MQAYLQYVHTRTAVISSCCVTVITEPYHTVTRSAHDEHPRQQSLVNGRVLTGPSSTLINFYTFPWTYNS
jgi:hypothetical protein